MKLFPVGLLLVSAFFASCERPTKIPVRDFFRTPSSWYYKISPCGTRISCLKPWGKTRRLNIFVKPVNGSGADERCVTSETTRDIDYYFWKGKDHLVYQIDPKCDQRLHICLVDLSSNKQNCTVTDLTADPNIGVTGIVDELNDSDDEILVTSNATDPKTSDVYRLKIVEGITGGVLERAAQSPGNVQAWISDQHGIVRAAITADKLDICLFTRQDENSEFELKLRNDFRHSIGSEVQLLGEEELVYSLSNIGQRAGLMAFAAEPNVLYALSNIGRNTRSLVMIDPKTGQELGPPLCVDQQFDARRIEFSARRGVTSAVFATSKWRREFLDQATETMFKAIADDLKVPEEEILITARDKNEEKFIVVVSSDRNPGQCYLFDQTTGRLTKTKLADRAPELNGHLAEMKPIEYTSRDGHFTIYGYLTLPLGCDLKKRLPLIVVPHGGPWLRNVWGFNRENQEVQFFANRGYAVLQMNFRGSIGYGSCLFQAGFKQLGQAMQDDVTDGVLEMITQGIADPKHIAIVGESYGGYAALAGITFTREREFRYAAAVDRAGNSNLLKYVETYKDARVREKVGDPENVQDRDRLIAFSPALHVDQITTPLFVAHGLNDPIVSPAQSDEIVAALCARHAKVEYLRLNEGHIFVNEENRIAYYEAVDEFLEKYLH